MPLTNPLKRWSVSILAVSVLAVGPSAVCAEQLSDKERKHAEDTLTTLGISNDDLSVLLEQFTSPGDVGTFVAKYHSLLAITGAKAGPLFRESAKTGSEGSPSVASDLNFQTLRNSIALLAMESLIEEKSARKEGKETGKLEGAKTEKKQSAQKNFLGLEFGLGLALSYDMEGERVESAALVDNLIRVDEGNRATPRLLWEIHYFFKYAKDRVPKATRKEYKMAGKDLQELKRLDGIVKGWGPFAGMQTSDDKAIDSFVLGCMFGWRRELAESRSFNLGFGVIVDSDVQVLGDGLHANQALPGAEATIRFKKEDRWGPVVVVSFSF